MSEPKSIDDDIDPNDIIKCKPKSTRRLMCTSPERWEALQKAKAELAKL